MIKLNRKEPNSAPRWEFSEDYGPGFIRTHPEPPHLNPESSLPPVGCPLLIELEPGVMVRAERPSFVRKRNDELIFNLSDGTQVFGHYRWSYP